MQNLDFFDNETIMKTPFYMYIIIAFIALSIIFYIYGTTDISLAYKFKELCNYLEETIRELLYKYWVTSKIQGNAVNIKYDDSFSFVDNAFDLDVIRL
jgi:hypothetical protein